MKIKAKICFIFIWLFSIIPLCADIRANTYASNNRDFHLASSLEASITDVLIDFAQLGLNISGIITGESMPLNYLFGQGAVPPGAIRLQNAYGAIQELAQIING
jgi:hypothetical protein